MHSATVVCNSSTSVRHCQHAGKMTRDLLRPLRARQLAIEVAKQQRRHPDGIGSYSSRTFLSRAMARRKNSPTVEALIPNT